MDPIVVVGASGFGRETLDVLDACQFPIAGVIDDQPSQINLDLLARRGVRYLGTIEQQNRRAQAPLTYVIGVGNPGIRRRIARIMDVAGHSPTHLIHPRASVGVGTELAPGTIVCAGAIVSTNVQTGQHVHINPGCVIGHDTQLQEFVSINPAANVSGNCVIETGVLVGASATVLQQLTVGSGSLIGAGALVTKDVPRDVVVTGVPGRWTERSQTPTRSELGVSAPAGEIN